MKSKIIAFLLVTALTSLILGTPIISPGQTLASTPTVVGGNISVNTTWVTANSPYSVTQSVLVAEGVTLSIEPGVTIRFAPNLGLRIDGELLARGTVSAPITFTSSQSSPAPGDWGNVSFTATSVDATFDGSDNYTSGSIMEYCTVAYAGASSSHHGIAIDSAAPLITNCTISNGLRNGIYAVNADNVIIEKSTLTDNGDYGIEVDDSPDAVIRQNTITDSGNRGIYLHGNDSDYAQILDNTIRGTDSNAGIYCSDYSLSNVRIAGNKVSECTSHGVYLSMLNNTTIDNNNIQNNSYDGIYLSQSDYTTVSNNVITGNSYGIYNSGSSMTIQGNNISRNSDSGIFCYSGSNPTITGNTITYNTADSGAGIKINSYSGTATVQNNTLDQNVSAGSAVELPAGVTFTGNNLWADEDSPYLLSISSTSGSVGATNNYWGTDNQSGISALIYDFFDNSALGLANFEPFLTAPDTDAPLPPPAGLRSYSTTDGDEVDFALFWDASLDSNVTGYKVYYGTSETDVYDGTGAAEGASPIDAGNVTTFNLTGLDAANTHYIAVTAYATTRESWHSQEAVNEGVLVDNANLAALAVSPGTLDPEFSEDQTAYTVLLDSSVTTLDVTGTPVNNQAVMTIDGTVQAHGVSRAVPVDVDGQQTVITIVVTAEDGVTTKTYTIVAADTLLSDPPNPVSPTDGQTISGTTSATLTWEAVAGATTYRVAYSASDNFTGAVENDITAPLTAFSTSAGALVPATTYYWRVRVQSPANGSWSAARSFTTAPSAADGTEIGGTVNANTVWTAANSPYIIQQSILVAEGVTLTIEPGVTVKIDPGRGFRVDGELVARGTADSRITFTSNAASPEEDDWGGIAFTNTSVDASFTGNDYLSGSVMEYCTVEYAGYSNQAGVAITSASPFINRCEVRNNGYYGIYVNSGSGIRITHNRVNNNHQQGIYLNSHSNATVSDNIIEDNSYGAYFRCTDSVITRNKIEDNSSYGIHLYIPNNVTVSNNYILSNSGGGVYWNRGAGSIDVENNLIAYNHRQSSTGGGMHIEELEDYDNEDNTFQVSGNTFIGNQASHGSAVYVEDCTGLSITQNTFVDNVATGGSAVELPPQVTFTNNNLWDNGNYKLGITTGTDTVLTATNNYWGTADAEEIATFIKDFFNDSSKGTVQYTPYLSTLDLNAPLPPPKGLQTTATAQDAAVTLDLSWEASADPAVTGYKVYYGTGGGLAYDDTGAAQGDSPIDAGNVTAYTLSGLDAMETYYITVTAYDGTRESMYAQEAVNAGTLQANANLLSLTVNSGSLSPAFSAGQINYTVSLNADATELTITPTLVNSRATMTVNNTAQTNGAGRTISLNDPGQQTVITIIITAEDSVTIKTYTVTATVASNVGNPPAGGGGGGGGGGGAGITSFHGSISGSGRFVSPVEGESTDGKVTVVIPKDTVGKNRVGQPLANMTIKEKSDPPAAPADSNVIGLTYDFGPAGATFEPPISVVLEYDEDLLPEGVSEGNLKIANWDETLGEWVVLDCVVDTEANTITAQVSHFSLYTVISKPNPAEFMLADLKVIPAEIGIGEVANISAVISNTGDLGGSYQLVFSVNGGVIEQREITLGGGGSEVVFFTAIGEEVGSYSFSINDLTGEYTVIASAAEEPQPQPLVTPEAEPVPQEVMPSPITPSPEELLEALPPVEKSSWPFWGTIIVIVALVLAGYVVFRLVSR